MYFIIETEAQLQKLEQSEECFVNLILNNDSYHPLLASPSLVYYNNGKKGYMLCVQHSECFSMSFERIKQFIQSHQRVYVLDKKFHSYFFDHSYLIDVNFTILDRSNDLLKFDCETLTKKGFYSRFGLEEDINKLVPISKHYESAECLHDLVKQFIGLESNLQFYDEFCEAYKYVETKGIKLSPNYVEFFGIGTPHFFEKDELVYSSYNLYNLTGRPTNAFNGFNFLSIPKTEKARSLVLPKHDFFVEFDFDGYHPRLIAELLGSSLSKESVHLQFGKQYFSKEELTDEEYQESKRITFKQLYGSIEERFENLPFFKDMKEYIEKQYSTFKNDKVYTLPSGRTIKYDREISKLKLFNYVVQNYETVKNVKIIHKIKDYLSHKKSQLVLVAYDAFLIDFNVKDGQTTLAGIKSILEEEGMVVKHKHGKTYELK